MSFLKYPAYKDSGVEWLGEVPEHWIMGSLKNMAQIRNGRDYKEVESSDGEYPVIGSGGQFSNATQYLYEGESVLLGRKGTIDKPLYINGRFWTVDTMFYTEISKGACAKFFYYNSLTIPFDYYSTSTALPSMTQADLLNHPAAIPTKLEQTQIARFLDHETARIDALIEEQQRLIELLKEKRQAVISHAVTKGLDPTVPMKDSGVGWLGEVPAHWEVTQVKRRCDLITDGAHISPETENGVYCFVSTRDVSDEGIDFEGCLRTSADSYEYLVRTGCQPEVGDVLFSKDGTIGRTIVVSENSPDFVVASSLIIIRPSRAALLSQYLDFLCQSWVVSQQVESFVKGAGLPRLSIQNLSKVVGVFPPLEEQALIADFLQLQCVAARRLTSEALRTMELLKERRSALISAAVTGKIDVRGWQPPTSTQAPKLAVAEAV
ncbi:restriction endonuclease subunit S [Stutzerimonas kunmingensis]|uniref:restriction endonuclease subunit S n=1 Tax=Stutzerimonas kunmingensis TaxID=1211807 RepID=UPI0028B08E9C|nr:restriction endonuclease subunit S [Stutzerimonas kunmingensis]